MKNMVRREKLIGGRRKKNGGWKGQSMGGKQRKVRRSAITNILREERSKQNLRRYTTKIQDTGVTNDEN